MDAAREVKKYFKALEIVDFIEHPAKTGALFGELDFMVGMRLHSMIFSTLLSTPFHPIVYDQKVNAFVNDVGLTQTISQVETFYDDIDLIVNNFKNRRKTKTELKRGLKIMKTRSKLNEDVLKNL